MRDEDHLVGNGRNGGFLHVIDERVQGFLATANLLHGNEVALIVDVQHGLDVQKRTRPGACLRDASTAPQEHEVVDGEPVR